MMNKLPMICLLLAMLLGVCFSTITWTSMKLSNGKTAYYSASCSVDWSKLKPLGGTFNMDASSCIPVCNAKSADVFDASVSGCFCFKRDKAVAPYPFNEIKNSDSKYPHYCGCIEPSSGK